MTRFMSFGDKESQRLPPPPVDEPERDPLVDPVLMSPFLMLPWSDMSGEKFIAQKKLLA